MHEELDRVFSLEGRVAVVTGGASGIGRETGYVLALAGADVALVDRNPEGLAESAGRITALGRKATTHVVDVSDKAQVDAVADAAVAAHGRLDIWVNAAGVLRRRLIMDTPEDELGLILAINLKGSYWGVAAAGRAMKASGRGGAIINVSSAGADTAQPEISVYAMTKAAVNMLTRDAAKEFGEYGVRVNAIAPGWVDTPMTAYRFNDGAGGVVGANQRAEIMQGLAQGSPLGLTGEPRDIALTMLYLACDASRMVTGQVLRPNGGTVMPT